MDESTSWEFLDFLSEVVCKSELDSIEVCALTQTLSMAASEIPPFAPQS